MVQSFTLILHFFFLFFILVSFQFFSCNRCLLFYFEELSRFFFQVFLSFYSQQFLLSCESALTLIFELVNLNVFCKRNHHFPLLVFCRPHSVLFEFELKIGFFLPFSFYGSSLILNSTVLFFLSYSWKEWYSHSKHYSSYFSGHLEHTYHIFL